ncbi:protein spaetzle 5 isoform X2 [Harpegnathos saltator]|uniref:protein spaetzle 5 isoform X2 n=1 Tax=Harpegnathos saltator TaxID=610380 RepID=UPI00058D0DF9|nr:protein spaetzle 5 isoform X2 [Harpegnathos saltator]XP_025163355.1 protein spaetzle 5 isoform X2 [Harpegnathos saltator]
MAIAWHLMTILFPMVIRGEPCTEYGCPGRPPYEPFVPAPPGHTPNCAAPGQTFCESPDHYPRRLIKFLVDKCSYDFSSALRDESRDDFNSYSSPPDYNQGYDYPRQDGTRLFQPTGQPAPIYGPPANSSYNHGYKYSAPSPPQSQRNPLLPDVAFKYHRNIQRQAEHTYSQEAFGPNQSWLTNRYSRSDKMAPRTYRVNPLLSYAKSKSSDRVKRQSNADTVVLCPTQAQYIVPRAALNNQGNWMYIVNLSDQDNKYTQLVKSEKCLNDECNGICSLPMGYRSRCQQQFVQKRLVALEGSGNRLYTDVFWFPHSCTCEIAPNY